jgi:hypothetical protein
MQYYYDGTFAFDCYSKLAIRRPVPDLVMHSEEASSSIASTLIRAALHSRSLCRFDNLNPVEKSVKLPAGRFKSSR